MDPLESEEVGHEKPKRNSEKDNGNGNGRSG